MIKIGDTAVKKIISTVILLAVAGTLAFGAFHFWGNSSNADKENLIIESVLKDASELTTQKLYVSDVFESTKGKIPLINKSKYLVHYKTRITAGFDVSEIEYDVTEDTITVHIPHCTIDEESIKIASEDITLYDTNISIIKANSEQTLQIVADAEKKAEEYAKNPENGFLQAADENAKEVIKQLLEAANEGYNIVVDFK